MTRTEANKLTEDLMEEFESRLKSVREKLKVGGFGIVIVTTEDGFFDFYVKRLMSNPAQTK